MAEHEERRKDLQISKLVPQLHARTDRVSSYKFNVLQKLSIRIKHRRTISFVQGKYDGSIPAESARPLNIEREDVDLLWALLDYPAISSSSDVTQLLSAAASVTPPIDSCTTVASETGSAPWQDQVSLQVGQSEPDFAHFNGDAARLSQAGTQNMPADHLAGWDPSQDFNNDWSFFGRPWAAYTSSDGWYAPTWSLQDLMEEEVR